jgi:hypothetical protein
MLFGERGHDDFSGFTVAIGQCSGEGHQCAAGEAAVFLLCHV